MTPTSFIINTNTAAIAGDSDDNNSQDLVEVNVILTLANKFAPSLFYGILAGDGMAEPEPLQDETVNSATKMTDKSKCPFATEEVAGIDPSRLASGR